MVSITIEARGVRVFVDVNGGDVQIRRDLPKSDTGKDLSLAPEAHLALCHRGQEAFAELIDVWAKAFGEYGVTQPDRGGFLSEAAQQHGRAVLLFVGECRGLTRAVRSVLARKFLSLSNRVETEDEFRQRARLIAENIAQVAGALGALPMLGDYLEYDEDEVRYGMNRTSLTQTGEIASKGEVL